MCANEAGWIELFIGEDLKGWHILNRTAEFKVENGIIIGICALNKPNTFLVTQKNFGDFILTYEAKENDRLNSGVQFRTNSLSEYHNGRVHGCQAELDATPRAWSGWIYDEALKKWFYSLECNPKAKSAFKNEEWNKVTVEAIGNHIRVLLNDVPTADIIDNMIPSELSRSWYIA